MLDDHTNSDQEAEKDEIVTELSADDRHLLDIIQQLLEPCDRITMCVFRWKYRRCHFRCRGQYCSL
ncbi:MAG: hypothetical protein KME52_22175 [Desmonostoc geniculatum HA4340-LM1]|jgi:hypothetical protein|nr:hypothetical protein [Desmonostoc geniculatum HA4340-LM1]